MKKKSMKKKDNENDKRPNLKLKLVYSQKELIKKAKKEIALIRTLITINRIIKHSEDEPFLIRRTHIMKHKKIIIPSDINNAASLS